MSSSAHERPGTHTKPTPALLREKLHVKFLCPVQPLLVRAQHLDLLVEELEPLEGMLAEHGVGRRDGRPPAVAAAERPAAEGGAEAEGGGPGAGAQQAQAEVKP